MIFTTSTFIKVKCLDDHISPPLREYTIYPAVFLPKHLIQITYTLRCGHVAGASQRTFCICLPLWSPTPDKHHVLLGLIPTILSVTLKPRLVSTLFLSISSSSVNPHPILSVFFHNCMEWLYNNYFL